MRKTQNTDVGKLNVRHRKTDQKKLVIEKYLPAVFIHFILRPSKALAVKSQKVSRVNR